MTTEGNRMHTDHDLLAVVSQSGAAVTFFDAVTHQPVATVRTPAQPHELCHDPDRGVLYCAITYRSGYYRANSGPAHEIAVIDTASREVTDVIDVAPEHAPHGLALDRRRGLLYVSVEERDHAPGGVLVVDTATRETVGRIDTMAPGPHWFVITPDGRHGYAANKEARHLSVVDLDSRTLVGRIGVPGSEGIAVSPDGRELYAAAPDANPAGTATRGVRVIDTATGCVRRILETEGFVVPVHTTADGTLLVAEKRRADGAEAAGVLGVHAPGTLELLGRVPVGRFPLTITSSPDATTAYVSCVLSSTVTVVDLAGPAVVGELRVAHGGEGGAHGLAYLPAGG
ncbi:YncE family protein [Streptantibioticus cattleyicolor]|uniref:Putative surface layer protein n=1 Tax=Streptantibioticus cattleyicolor (strain ATCC 35852 / DSM 46488 / JCM 4925 / NBRC 14057 / NRRL 8057) TaxID=1003195 RepID=F8JJH1_STREN|nr:hypothetical protein [Streptantibioticus cattleyicolor]AEW98703.1 putative surface layer protein [Streptantibioticus cattleyicolor NRRL 8057 = DSM 46488]CCB72241.1 putative surface layer protein [Streptantibioticus cattleyicolor NRRL 8057 = DSM 46488]